MNTIPAAIPPDLTQPASLLLLFPTADQELLRRCASVRVCDRLVFDQVLRHELDAAMSFQEVGALYFVERLPGPEDRLTMSSAMRAEIFDTWWGTDGRGAGDGAPAMPAALGKLSQRLADFYAAQGNDLERLFHLAVVDEAEAIKLLDALFDAADAQFDLPQCFAVLRTLDERPNELLGPGLREALAAKRLRLDTRGLWAQEYRETVPYVERNETRRLLDDLLADPQRWILNLHAPGGMGKSMFIRAVLARRCVPENIPCAKVDFDFVPHLANIAAEPWRILLHMAQQLTRQLRDNPFQELLTAYGSYAAEADKRIIISPREFVGSDLSPADKAALAAEVLSRFTGALLDVRPSVVLILDTLENLLHGHVDLEALFDLLAEVHARCPHVRVILAGRLDLEQPLPGVAGQTGVHTTDFGERFGGQNIAVRLKGFDDDEAHTYLEAKRGLANDDRVPVMIAIARIQDGDHGREGVSPFKLALLADIVRVHPTISAQEFARYQDVDLAYLIERVVDRIHDDQVKWLVRYGVAPRLLTKEVVEGVLVPFMVQGMRGQTDQDDATQDPSVEPQLDTPPFPVRAAQAIDIDVKLLWETLYRYTAEYSWVIEDEAVGALRFHPDVIEPMRRLLRKHQTAGRRILSDLHLACARYYEQRAQTDAANRAQWLGEAVYHQLQGDAASADAFWLRLLQAASDQETIVALAEEAVREPLIFDEPAREAADEMLRFGAAVRARAHFEVARWIAASREDPSPDDWRAVDRHLATIDSLGAAAGQAAPAADIDYLRGRSLFAQRQPQRALEICQRALRNPASPANEMEFRMLYGQILRALDQPEAVEQFAHAAALAEELQPDRLLAIAPSWVEALEAEERYQEAAQVCQSWRDKLGKDGEVEPVGESLLAHLRQYLAVGQEQRAAELAQEGLNAWLAAASGQLTALGSWPDRLQAEILLAQQQPAEAFRQLERNTRRAIKGRSAARPPFETELRARSLLALVDPLRAKPEIDTLVKSIYGPQTKAGIAWRLAYAQLHSDETGDLRQAADYQRQAQENALEPVSQVRCELLRIRLLARQGHQEQAQSAANALATRADLPRLPSLRLLVHLEDLIQRGAAEAWQPLLAALQAVEPASRRLLLLAELRRCRVPLAISPAISQALLALLPPSDAEGSDPALGALRWAEVLRVIGQGQEARRLLEQAAAACRAPLRLAVLRQVYCALDRAGWEQAALQQVTLDELAEPAAGESHELAGLTLLEHGERLAAALHDGQRAMDLLNAAEVLLKSTAGLWMARIIALRARVTALSGDFGSADQLADQAAKGFLAVDDPVSAEALRQTLYPTSPPDGVAFSAPLVEGADGLSPRLDVRLAQEGRIWRVELARSNGRVWAGDVALQEDLAALLDSGTREVISHRFVEAFERDWQTVTLAMGRHLFPPDARALLDASDQPLDIRLDVKSPLLQWLPWELLRLDEDSLPLAVRADIGAFYRLTRQGWLTGPGDTQAGGVLIVRMTQTNDTVVLRGYEQTSGGALARRYRRAGIAYQELEQPGLEELRATLVRLRPAVVHMESNLVESGPQAALVFSGRRDLVLGDRVAQSQYIPNAPQIVTAGELAALMAGLEPSPLVLLDVPAPPVASESLRQLFLRNAFASEWINANAAPPTAILGTGLGGREMQDQVIDLLLELLRTARPVGAIARQLQERARLRLAKAPAVDGRSGFARSVSAQQSLICFAATALFTDRPEQVFPLQEAYK